MKAKYNCLHFLLDKTTNVVYNEVDYNCRRGGKTMSKAITESEYEIMKILWRSNQPLGLGEIMDASGDKWTRNTVGTLLTRLAEKGAIGINKQGKSNMYYAIVKEKDYSMSETKSFLSKLYEGSIGNLVACLYENKELSEEEIESLRKIINGD